MRSKALLSFGGFLFSFGASKFLAFAGPLLVAYVATPEIYGAFELALSIAIPAALMASMGVVSAAPQLYLVEKDEGIIGILRWYVLGCAASALLLSLLAWVLFADPFVAIYIVMVGFSALQIALSNYCRMMGLRLLSGWADNVAMITVSLEVSALALITGGIAPGEFYAIVAITLPLAIALTLRAMPFHGSVTGRRYREAVRMGLPMMLNGIVIVAFSYAQRMIVGVIFGLSGVAIFSLCSRAALLLILVHQTLATGFFVRLYGISRARMDLVAAGWLALHAAGGFALSLALQQWAGLLGFDPAKTAEVVRLFPFIATQSVFWIAIALFEMWSNREGTAGQVVMAAIPIGLITVAVIFGIEHSGLMTLPRLCLAFDIAPFVLFLAQVILLWRKGIRLPATILAALLGWAPVALSWSTL